ncbi:hypothetical protein EPO05_06230 [Patescibacteria group bacterium]|nr:MAG: hypothetical protein EPO05_06230 [Patescibacteria group bacterium]
MQLTVLPVDNRLTHSRRSCMHKCNRKHQLAYELGLKPEGTPRPFRMGDAYHRGLEVIKAAGGVDAAVAESVRFYDEPPPPFMTQFDWDVERETVAQLVNGYAWYWGNRQASGQLLPEWTIAEVVANEQVFALQLEGVDVAGKIDGIVRLGDGRLAVLEHKTTSDDIAPAPAGKPANPYWLRLRIDGQISMYFAAARAMGHDVRTVLYDVTAKPRISPKQIPVLDADGKKIVVDAQGVRQLKVKKKKDGSPAAGDGEPYQTGDAEKGWTLQTRVETPVEFGDRLRADIAERPAYYYGRQEIPRLNSDIEEFLRELKADKHALEYFRWKGIWPRNTQVCTVYGTCEYFKLCHNGWNPSDGVPVGFVQIQDVHRELNLATEGATE